MLDSARDSGLSRNGNFLVFKHPLDDPGNLDKIGNHRVLVANKPNEIASKITSETKTIMIAGISHFTKDSGIAELIDAIIRSNRQIIATGLNLASDGKPYGSMPEIMALADEIIVAKALCNQANCDSEANRSLKIKNKFEPRCAYHHKYTDGRPISIDRNGSLEIFAGPMFSSKSTSLEKAIKRYEIKQSPYIIFKWNKDKRYRGEINTITLHSGQRIQAYPINSYSEITDILSNKKNTQVVMIDEAQFIDGLYSLIYDLIPQGYKIICTGLPRGFNRKPFADFPKLMCLADDIKYKNGICVECHDPATENQRMKKINGSVISAHYSDPLIAVGGSDTNNVEYFYQARCLDHWKLDGEPKLRFELPSINNKH